MGRWSTGAVTTGECLQVNISAFIKYIKKGAIFSHGSITWETGASISIALIREGEDYIVKLDFTKTDHNGEKHLINQKISIVSVPFNLGKGEIYYFICPFTFRRCKILYMGYGSLYFKSREAYKHRIYYRSQIRSKLDRHLYRAHDLEKKLDQLYEKRPKTHYKGKKTAIKQRIERLEKDLNYHERMKWIVVPKVIEKMYIAAGFKDASQLV